MRVIRRTEAKQDLIEQAAFIAKDNVDAAWRFLEAAESTFTQLAGMPGMGAPRDFGKPALAGVRSWRVQGFENYLIFYRPTDEGIEVIRVLHGAQDVETILEGD